MRRGGPTSRPVVGAWGRGGGSGHRSRPFAGARGLRRRVAGPSTGRRTTLRPSRTMLRPSRTTVGARRTGVGPCGPARRAGRTAVRVTGRPGATGGCLGPGPTGGCPRPCRAGSAGRSGPAAIGRRNLRSSAIVRRAVRSAAIGSRCVGSAAIWGYWRGGAGTGDGRGGPARNAARFRPVLRHGARGAGRVTVTTEHRRTAGRGPARVPGGTAGRSAGPPLDRRQGRIGVVSAPGLPQPVGRPFRTPGPTVTGPCRDRSLARVAGPRCHWPLARVATPRRERAFTRVTGPRRERSLAGVAGRGSASGLVGGPPALGRCLLSVGRAAAPYRRLGRLVDPAATRWRRRILRCGAAATERAVGALGHRGAAFRRGDGHRRRVAGRHSGDGWRVTGQRDERLVFLGLGGAASPTPAASRRRNGGPARSGGAIGRSRHTRRRRGRRRSAGTGVGDRRAVVPRPTGPAWHRAGDAGLGHAGLGSSGLRHPGLVRCRGVGRARPGRARSGGSAETTGTAAGGDVGIGTVRGTWTGARRRRRRATGGIERNGPTCAGGSPAGPTRGVPPWRGLVRPGAGGPTGRGPGRDARRAGFPPPGRD
ncbi:hypothetical protein D0Q02_18235 [Micromonospora craniellae]|uniref:Uncharacterized protein n=1 Tax=Micromonospora craniellae TaxID=2294034 RepID=A0A372FWJ6_9ACTN|nr:hypothetical protein D0Q02_18235 [Micromonospora craniellae]